ncbi:MAG: hypothetical protein J2P38_05675, partial [Candidatus Dormibacteraeota bacterium]|nr:hypothetical protein [Candidatus Dormibacteraeota bacterium]
MDPVAAATANHQSWNAALAAVAGGTVEQLEPGTLTYVPTGGGDLEVLYTGEPGAVDEMGRMVDAVLEGAR